MVLPALRSLWKEGQRWHGVCHPRVNEVYAATGLFERLTLLDGPPWTVWIPLRRWKPERTVVFTPTLTGRILAWLTGAPLRLGRGPFGLTHSLSLDTRRRRLWRAHMELAVAAGGEESTAPDFSLQPGANAEAAAEELLPSTVGPYVAVAPGASFGPAKMWPLESLSVVVEAVRAKGTRTVLVGGPAEASMGDSLQVDVNVAGRTTLPEAVAVLKRCQALVTNDSGAMHLGRAARVPLVAVFGSTSPQWTGLEPKEGTVLYREEACSPCFKRTCPLSGRDHMKCMKGITPEHVLRALETVL